MKAIVFERYGPPEVLQIKEVARPVPRDNEVLVKVHATSVTLYDCWCRSGTAPPGFGLMMRIASGIGKPKKPILGTELAGEIEEVDVLSALAEAALRGGYTRMKTAFLRGLPLPPPSPSLDAIGWPSYSMCSEPKSTFSV